MIITILLILVNFAVWGFGHVYDLNSLSFLPILFHSKFYLIFTSMFMHADLNHLLVNMFGLLVFGSILEKEVGKRKFLLIYLMSGVAASFAYLAFGESMFIPAVGASGAIFGIMGALAAIKPTMIVWTQFGPFPMVIAAGVWMGIEFFNSRGVDSISQVAHIGGIVFGVIVGTFARFEIDYKIFFGVLVVISAGSYAYSYTIDDVMGTSDVPNFCKENFMEKGDNYYFAVYGCDSSNLVVSSLPSRSNAKIESFYDELNVFVHGVYKDFYKEECAENATNPLVNGEIFGVSGNMCGHLYSSMGRFCEGGYNVRSVEFYEEEKVLNEVTCQRSLS